jgi:hypothetical protein|tara:strand:- start:1242 stop:1427 length:186 start_codon:yes stop_codon:yes gene_type:complete
MKNKNHIYFFGIMVFCSAILTGTSLILNSPYYKMFGGVMIIGYTVLQMLVGIERNDEREDI